MAKKSKTKAAMVVVPPKPKRPYRSACGFDAVGMDAFIDEAEELDKGTPRHPWSPAFRADLKQALEPCRDAVELRETTNRLVEATFGQRSGPPPFADPQMG